MPMGYARRIAHMQPNFNSVLNFQHVTKSAEPIMLTQEIPNIMRRAFTALRNGRPGPALIEVPTDIFGEDFEARSIILRWSVPASAPTPRM